MHIEIQKKGQDTAMEMEFDVKVTAGVLYDYLLYHTYTGLSGMIGTLVGAVLIMTFLSTNYFIYLIAGVVLIAYLPGALFLRAMRQVQNTPAFKKPLHYKMTEEGISGVYTDDILPSTAAQWKQNKKVSKKQLTYPTFVI